MLVKSIGLCDKTVFTSKPGGQKAYQKNSTSLFSFDDLNSTLMQTTVTGPNNEMHSGIDFLNRIYKIITTDPKKKNVSLQTLFEPIVLPGDKQYDTFFKKEVDDSVSAVTIFLKRLEHLGVIRISSEPKTYADFLNYFMNFSEKADPNCVLRKISITDTGKELLAVLKTAK